MGARGPRRWRLATTAWGRGLAAEAAREVLRHAFEQLELAEVISFTTPANLRSQLVMQRLGMRSGPADHFDHPRMIERGYPELAPHVLYRISPEGASTARQV